MEEWHRSLEPITRQKDNEDEDLEDDGDRNDISLTALMSTIAAWHRSRY